MEKAANVAQKSRISLRVKKVTLNAKKEQIASIEISKGPKSSWEVLYSVKELRALHDSIQKAVGAKVKLPEPPSAAETSCTGEQLQRYLNELFAHKEVQLTQPYVNFVSYDESTNRLNKDQGIFVVRSSADVKSLISWMKKSRIVLKEVIFYFK